MPTQHGVDLARSSHHKSPSKHICRSAACSSWLTNVHRFSEDFPTAKFVKLDVDEVPDVAQELSIRAMPTFVIFKDGEIAQTIVGANPKALLAAIETHAEK